MSATTAEAFTADVTQFLRPNGRQRQTTTDLPVTCAENYKQMLAHGCRLEAEVLNTDEVSVTISTGESDLDVIIHSNGLGLQEAIADMINRKAWDK
jgi:hypothetical protein